MLKLLKWIYNKGAQNERTRIKQILREFQAESQARMNEYNAQFGLLDDRKKTPKMDKSMQIEEQAVRLIVSLIEPTETYGTVTMAPPAIDRDKSINEF